MSRFERLDGEKISKEAQKKSEWQATNPLRRSVKKGRGRKKGGREKEKTKKREGQQHCVFPSGHPR